MRLGKNQLAILKFYWENPTHHAFGKDSITVRTAQSLVKRGLLEVKLYPNSTFHDAIITPKGLAQGCQYFIPTPVGGYR